MSFNIKFTCIFILFFLSVVYAGYTQPPLQKANYALAAKFDYKNLKKLVFSTSVKPNWMRKSKRFWYEYETTKGTKWYIVDIEKKQKVEMFDNAKMAADLTRITRQAYDAEHLPTLHLKLTEKEDGVTFSLSVGTLFHFEYNFQKKELKKIDKVLRNEFRPSWVNISPNGNTIVFARNYNLYAVNREDYKKLLVNQNDTSVKEKQLTTDGVEYFGYNDKKDNKRTSVSGVWSSDSRHFAVVKKDERKVKDFWLVNSTALPRPTLQSYKYDLPGESEASIQYLVVFDVVDSKHKVLRTEKYKGQILAILHSTNDHFYLTRSNRDLRQIDVLVADANQGTVVPVIEEKMNTYIETKKITFVNGGNEIIHWSEKDGWGHFYLHNKDGALKNQITSGGWHCQDIVRVDEKKRILYFTANGREPNEDPYYNHFYKINFDGTGLTLLNPGNYDHDVSLNGDNSFFIDNYSRVNTIPATALYNTQGKKIMDLERADLSSLFASGYKFPEIFVVKANDGITDLFGVMYKPYDFDKTKKYPVAAYVYPGPQTEVINKQFLAPGNYTDRLAQIGVVIVAVGNRGGSPERSKYYHNYGFGNIRDYAVADKKTALEQLADRHAYIDIGRVGIHGFSGGGSLSATAMLLYPDFFKVGVAASGNHDNTIYSRWWNEKYNGVKEQVSPKGDTTFVYTTGKNTDLAKNLKGRLLLSTGDIDDNVHPAHTLRMASALMKANKRFDLVVFPGQSHNYGLFTEWHFWSVADYYAKWLLRDFEQPVDIVEMNRDVEMTNK